MLFSVIILICSVVKKLSKCARVTQFICALVWMLASYYAVAAPAPITINFWHAMAGPLGKALQDLTDDFNASQDDYRVLSSYKGDYTTVLTNAVAAYRSQRQPHLVQVYDIATAMMTLPPGAVIPLHQLLEDNNAQKLGVDIFPAVRNYYADQQQRLLALPFNVSVPVLYYNKESFRKAGLDPEQAPSTWPMLEEYAQRLLKAGNACGFTTTWPAWIHMEAFSARHNIAFVDQENGFSGLAEKLLVNNSAVRYHLEKLGNWQKQGVFNYGGQGDSAQSLFTSGRCAMMFQSSGSMLSLQSMLPFAVGMAPLPYWPEINMQPGTSLVGGAALWTLSGHSAKEYQGVVAFMRFLMRPKQQATWVINTGYLALTAQVMQLPQVQSFYKKHPAARVAQQMITANNSQKSLLLHKPFSRGIRIGYYSSIRESNNEALEEVCSGKKSAQQALMQAEKRAEYLLRRFKRYA